MNYMFEAHTSTTIEMSVSDNLKGRLERLHRIVGYVVALAEHFGNKGIVQKVESLDDHEGTLTVTWRVAPSLGEKEFFSKAWGSMIGDGCDVNVEHELQSRNPVHR